MATSVEISVIMPVFNEKPEHLKMALKSIMNQSETAFELILIDDGSNLPTSSLLIDWASSDSRILLIRNEKNVGLTQSLNIGLKHSKGNYIARHDSDDWSDHARFKIQKDFLDSHPDVGLLGTARFLHQEDGSPLWLAPVPVKDQEIREHFKYGNPFSHGSVMFRKSIANNVGGYNPEIKKSQDYDFFYRVSRVTSVANIPQGLYHLRKRADSISATSQIEQAIFSDVTKHRANNPDDPATTQELVDLYRRKISAIPPSYFQMKRADELLLAGYSREALSMYSSVTRSEASLRAILGLFRGLYFSFNLPCRESLFKSLFS